MSEEFAQVASDIGRIASVETSNLTFNVTLERDARKGELIPITLRNVHIAFGSGLSGLRREREEEEERIRQLEEEWDKRREANLMEDESQRAIKKQQLEDECKEVKAKEEKECQDWIEGQKAAWENQRKSDKELDEAERKRLHDHARELIEGEKAAWENQRKVGKELDEAERKRLDEERKESTKKWEEEYRRKSLDEWKHTMAGHANSERQAREAEKVGWDSKMAKLKKDEAERRSVRLEEWEKGQLERVKEAEARIAHLNTTEKAIWKAESDLKAKEEELEKKIDEHKDLDRRIRALRRLVDESEEAQQRTKRSRGASPLSPSPLTQEPDDMMGQDGMESTDLDNSRHKSHKTREVGEPSQPKPPSALKRISPQPTRTGRKKAVFKPLNLSSDEDEATNPSALKTPQPTRTRRKKAVFTPLNLSSDEDEATKPEKKKKKSLSLCMPRLSRRDQQTLHEIYGGPSNSTSSATASSAHEPTDTLVAYKWGRGGKYTNEEVGSIRDYFSPQIQRGERPPLSLCEEYLVEHRRQHGARSSKDIQDKVWHLRAKK